VLAVRWALFAGGIAEMHKRVCLAEEEALAREQDLASGEDGAG
jgi:hypothetical protein